MLQKLRRTDEKGFTLIELMIVIAIIGILAAIAIPNFIEYRRKGYDADAQSNLKNLMTAQEAYFVDAATYTTTVADLVGFIQSGSVDVDISAATTTYYEAEATHTSSDNTWSVKGPGGIPTKM